jgi:rare lipoprotein A
MVRINDRGPFKRGRVIDLSRAAAEELGVLDEGLVRVRVSAVGVASADGSCRTA